MSITRHHIRPGVLFTIVVECPDCHVGPGSACRFDRVSAPSIDGLHLARHINLPDTRAGRTNVLHLDDPGRAYYLAHRALFEIHDCAVAGCPRVTGRSFIAQADATIAGVFWRAGDIIDLCHYHGFYLRSPELVGHPERIPAWLDPDTMSIRRALTYRDLP